MKYMLITNTNISTDFLEMNVNGNRIERTSNTSTIL